ncbi:plasmid partitioning protein RepB [Marinibacterium profundimaris]|uniref:Plasmid stablization protein ParB n=1 Tax=Marinibacterium profundimaris TaxID=1679460 RepID=A0A225NBW3_9RHOB|nr:plasmid partitioning protein RepB [Marinibacterium profundimaris]OWU68333.1 plasmid stablization protein ParB [Marinibacterium profundimaris]
MARKDLLKGLMEGNAKAAPSPAPRAAKGAIGAVSQSIAELRTRSLTEVPADMIDTAGLVDRLDPDDDLEAMIASIRDYGQQVPVLLRHSPNEEGRYEVVYGRRRVAALRALGQPVRAMIRDLKDRDLIIAQGQENTARKELSFIEKANFARQMVELGFERKIICDALHIDKTVISRMLKVTEDIPAPVIRAIGAAPSVGRDRWLALAERMAGQSKNALALAVGETSDKRFDAVFRALAPEKAPSPAPPKLTGVNGRSLGQVTRSEQKITLVLERAKSGDFGDWLAENIERIHRDYIEGSGE